MADKNERSVILTGSPTKAEQESATAFWDRLNREERARKQLRQGDPEKWPFPSSGYDAAKTVDAAKLAGAWGTPVQRLDTETFAQKEVAKTAAPMFEDVPWRGDTGRPDFHAEHKANVDDEEWSEHVAAPIPPPVTKPDLASWGTPAPAMSPNLEAEQDKRSFFVEESAPVTKAAWDSLNPKLCPPGAWGTK